MSTTPPPGFGVYVATFTVAGALRSQVNTWGFGNGGAFTAASALTLMNTNFGGSGKIYGVTLRNTQTVFAESYVLLNTGGVLTSAVTANAVAGTSTFASPAPNVSIVARKVTGLAGRQYRGRCALPSGFIDEADVNDAGQIGSSLAAYSTAAALTFAACVTSSIPLYLLHGPNKAGVTPVPTVMTGVLLDSLVGTQRRRIKR